MSAKNTRKGRKIGRNKVKCARYRAEGRREKNKARKAAKAARRATLVTPPHSPG